MKLFPLWLWLLWVDSSCHTLEQRRQQQTMRSQAAALHATSTYNPINQEIILACTVINQGREPLALLYEPALRTAEPNLDWAVIITSKQGIRLTDCSAPIIKGRIKPAREYTLLQPGQQLAMTINIQATDLLPSDNLFECRTKKTTVPAGTYQMQVLYHDAFRHHNRAVASLQSSLMTLTLN